MNKLLVRYNGSLKFRLKSNSPKSLILKSFHGNRLINPLYYHEFQKAEEMVVCKFHDDIYIKISFLIFEILNPKMDEDWREIEAGQFFPEFVKYLRWLTTETSVNHLEEFKIGVKIENFKLKKLNITHTIEENQKLNMNDFTSLINTSTLRNIDKLILNKVEIPVYEDLLIDAKRQLERKDFRKAILFAVMAIESMLTSKYDEKYSEIKNGKHNKNKFRVISMQTKNGNILKDPIYEKLIKRSNFENLLHEIPLYIIEKSLLLEDQKLYQSALKLYRTRNKIVHKGVIPDDNNKNFLPNKMIGAFEAYRIMIHIFRWMGINKFEIFLPDYHKSYEELK